MSYTKALEKEDTKWTLKEFISLHGSFSIIKEYETGILTGRFNNKGTWIHVHIERKIRGIPIPTILDHQEDYEVIVTIGEYCLYRKGDTIDYNTIWEDLHPYGCEKYTDYTAQDYYMDNPDIFDGEVM